MIGSVVVSIFVKRAIAQKERMRKEAEMVKTVRSDDVPEGKRARRFSGLRFFAIILAALPLAPVVAVICYHLFDSGMTPRSMVEYSLMIAIGFFFLWLFVVGSIVAHLKSHDQCPRCGKLHYYYKADRGLFMSCRKCKFAWKAGTAPI